MNFKKMLKNPWLILGGAVAVYWFWVRPRAAAASVTATPTQADPQANLNAQIQEVMRVRPGETSEQYESRLRAYELTTGQMMPTMNI